MSKTREASQNILKALEILELAEGKVQTPQQRQKTSIELASLMLSESRRIETRKESLKLISLSIFLNNKVEIVTPEREIPGTMASAWESPSIIESFTVTSSLPFPGT